MVLPCMLPFGGRRRRSPRGSRGVPRLRRGRSATAAAAQRQRQAADAADTPPRHHNPSTSEHLRLPAPIVIYITKTTN